MEAIPEGWLAPLAEEIVVVILSKLPVKSLMRFKSVSKRWLALITNDSSLIASHLHHHSVTNRLSILVCADEKLQLGLASYYQDTLLLCNESTVEKFDISYHLTDRSLIHKYGVKIVGSCNGLVCLSLSETGTTVVLLNPATKESRVLPEPIMPLENKSNFRKRSSVTMGFGFDRHKKDYKLVRIDRFLLDIEGVQVFTKSSNSWRQVRHGLVSTFVVQGFPAVAVNGSLHWLGWDEKMSKSCVLSFDLHEEEFYTLATPPQENESHLFRFKFANWRESLVALEDYNIWLFSNTEKSWTKLFKIDIPSYTFPWCGLFAVWRDRVLLCADQTLLSYEHPKISGKRSGEKVKVIKELRKFEPRASYSFQALDYVESLVSVNPTVTST